MTDRKPPLIETMIAINPFLAFWSMPYIMTYEMVTACLRSTARKDAKSRNDDPGQVPVPPSLQDTSDRELFA